MTPNKARHQKFLAQIKSESKPVNNDEFMQDGSNIDIEQLGKEMNNILTGVMTGVESITQTVMEANA